MANETMGGLFDEIIEPTTNTETEAVKTEEVAETEEKDEAEEVEAEEVEAETEKDEPKAEEKPTDEGCDPKVLENAKKELGMGGAAFCDELFVTCPSVFQRLKDAKKTLHGFFNYAYSYTLDEYVKKNGRQNGGGYWNLAELAEKYLDPNVKEGFTLGEPKAKKSTYTTPKPTKTDVTKAKKVVEKTLKKAAKDAKAQMDLFGDLFAK